MNELVRRDPFNTVAPFEESFFAIPSLFRPLSARAIGGPRMDVAENDTSYMLAIELAGVKKDAIQVSVYDNTVTIAADMPDPTSGEGTSATNWLLRERAFGKYSRSITLPEAVDEEGSEARYVDGVLYLNLKKRSASQTKRLAIH
jgi:HSP20 family protein